MKILEDVGHVLIGLVPGVGFVREWFQLPPENDANPVVFVSQESRRIGGEYWAAVRVRDVFRDWAGYELGSVIRTALLVWWALA